MCEGVAESGMRRVLAVVLVVSLLLPAFTGAAAAQSDAGQRLGGTVVVEADETVNGFTAYAGTVIVEGRVEGDLTAFAGRVVVEEGGTVTGRLRAFAGSVVVAGTTGGNAVAYAGHVRVRETGRVGGSFGAVGGGVVISGTVRDDATTVAGSVTLAPTADIDGFLTYVGEFDDQGGTVSLGARPVSELSLLPSLTGAGGVLLGLYLLAADLFVGVVLLTAFPAFAEDAAETVVEEPERIAVAGLGAALGIPVAVALAALTVVGIPLAVAGLVGFIALLWVGSIYGRYLLGALLLSYADREGRYLALAAGLLVTAVLALVPIVGDLLRAGLALAGVGVVALGLYVAYESVGDRRRPADADRL
jgi:cytoskeletal protein CcmA (bactofilin family)